MKNKIKRIHFIGIGGSGMSGIAEILINLGYEVSGSDLSKTFITERLETLGSKIFYEHNSSNVLDKDLVVISSAITTDNIEVLASEKKRIPIIKRAEMLAKPGHQQNALREQ